VIRIRRRRAFTLIIVLLLLAAALGTAFALMREQTMLAAVQQNHAADIGSRNAALTGLAAGMRTMSESTWGGISSTLNGSLPDGSSYTTTFAVGDPNLSVGNPDYSLYPMRVTVTSTGKQSLGGGSGFQTFVARAVVELVPRKINPAKFSFNQTVYHWSLSGTTLHMPMQVQGDMRIGGVLNLNPSYPTGSSKSTWLSSLKNLANGGQENRFVTGNLVWPALLNLTNSGNVETNLGINTTDQLGLGTAPFSTPSSLGTYRLYPGGPQYTPVLIPGSNPQLSSQSFAADPLTNPLGIFYVNQSSIDLRGSVTINGTLINLASTGDINVATGGSQQNITITAVTLPGLSGQSIAYPAAVTGDDITVGNGQQLTVTGAMVAGGNFSISAASSSSDFTMTGQLSCGTFSTAANSSWPTSSTTWDNYLNSWNFQRTFGQPSYALWLASSPRLLSPVPKLVFAPNTGTVDNLVPDFSQPVYGPGSSDSGGLRWRLISFRENP
jgi:hypothetical protein